MGKPNNTKQNGCVTTSSNCVVWQGPDISFLNLCTGDSISEVMGQFADKICLLLNVLSVNSYSHSCLNDTSCGPTNFIELLQTIIDEICELKGTTGDPAAVVASGCPDCELSVASCFQDAGVVQNSTDYLAAIGIKVCDMNITLQTQSAAILQLQSQQTAMQAQLDLIING